MKNSVFIIFWAISTTILNAQIITVLSNNQPLPNVEISDGETILITNKKGQADIRKLKKDNNLIFKYEDIIQVIDYQTIKKNNFKIELSENYFELEQIIVSANRWEQRISEVPIYVISINISNIDFYGPQTIADLLGTTGKVFIQKSQLGGGSPMIHGFAANRLLIVVDGVRMNNAIYRSGNLQNVINIDPYTLEDAEIILGAGSVVYGSDAMGGVMDFHTKKTIFAISDKPLLKINSAVKFSSADRERTFHTDINIGLKKWAFLTSFTYNQFDDLNMGKYGPEEYLRKEYVATINNKDTIVKNPDPLIQKYSGYGQRMFLQKISFAPKNNLKINYEFYYSTTTNIPRYDRLIQYQNDKLKYAQWYYGPQTWMMHNLNIRLKNTTFIWDNMKIVAAYQDYYESRHTRKLNKQNLKQRFENVKVINFNADLYKNITDQNTIFYGIEAVGNKVLSIGKQLNILTNEQTEIASRYPNKSDYLLTAIYLQDKHKFNDKLLINSGIRWNYVYLYAPFDTTFYKFPYTETKLKNSAFNGSIGIVYKPIDSWTLSLNAGTGFRAPNIDDIGKVFDSEPGKVVVPNLNLKPEYVYNFELGLKKINQNYFVDINGFYSIVKNIMVRRAYTFNGQDSIMYDGQISAVEALVNAGKGIIYGIDLSLGMRFIRYFVLKGTYSYMRGFDDEGYAIRHVPPDNTTAHLEFNYYKIKADFFVMYNNAIPYEHLAPSERNKPHIYATDPNGKPYCPNWYTLNIHFNSLLYNHLKIVIGIDNILDIRYRPYSSGIVAPGRNFILGLHYLM